MFDYEANKELVELQIELRERDSKNYHCHNVLEFLITGITFLVQGPSGYQPHCWMGHQTKNKNKKQKKIQEIIINLQVRCFSQPIFNKIHLPLIFSLT